MCGDATSYEYFLLKDLDNHCSKCLKEEIPCTFSEIGCKTRPMRKDLDNHIAQNQQQHLDCAMASILRLRQELATTRGELQEVQSTLSTCMDEAQTLPMVFKMSNFAQIKEAGDTWYSAPFYSRRSECRLRLCVRPLPTPSNPGEVDVTLEVLTRQFHATYDISLTVQILNQAKDGGHITYTQTAMSTYDSLSCRQRVVLSVDPVCADLTRLGADDHYSTYEYLSRDCLFFRVSESEKLWLYHAKKLCSYN